MLIHEAVPSRTPEADLGLESQESPRWRIGTENVIRLEHDVCNVRLEERLRRTNCAHEPPIERFGNGLDFPRNISSR